MPTSWGVPWMAIGTVSLSLLLHGCGSRSDTVASIAVHPTKSSFMYIATDEAVYKTRDGGTSWVRLNGELTRTRVTGLFVDPQLPANIFAGTMADGVYKSPDGGRRWFPHNAGIQKGTISVNVQDLAFHPRSSQTLYAATTVGIFRSTNGGQSWVERMAGMTEINFVVTLAINPEFPNILYAGTTGGVFRSLDGSESWAKINTGLVPADAKMASMALGINTLRIDPLATEIVYAGTTRGLFKTTNLGETWSRLGQSLGKIYVSSLVIHPSDSQILYLGSTSGLYKTMDGGQSWEAINQGLETLNVRVVRMDPSNPHILYCGTIGGGLNKSSDGGRTWVRLALKQKT